MCFETAMTAAICEGGCERVAPDRSDNSHTMSARWLDGRTAKSACRLSGGRAVEQHRHQGESGRQLAPGSAPDRLPTGGWL